MNDTVKSILLSEYHAARRAFTAAKDSMDSAINWRVKAENELLRATNHERSYAERCQEAHSKLEDIVKFLRDNGVKYE